MEVGTGCADHQRAKADDGAHHDAQHHKGSAPCADFGRCPCLIGIADQKRTEAKAGKQDAGAKTGAIRIPQRDGNNGGVIHNTGQKTAHNAKGEVERQQGCGTGSPEKAGQKEQAAAHQNHNGLNFPRDQCAENAAHAEENPNKRVGQGKLSLRPLGKLL